MATSPWQIVQDDDAFERSELNTVKRFKDRATYERNKIVDIFRQTKISHVSFLHNHLPQCIPMITALEETPDGELFAYFHGATNVYAQCFFMRLVLTSAKAYSKARFTQDLQERDSPMVATATIFDGYVLALSLFHHSLNYRSAVLHGVSMPFDDDDDEGKRRALKFIVDSTTPGRWENSR
jgi:nitroimidazol reductase NimA-like FMN-containing flavoprotein (pyridoxamine 5'-phosphate oxidase superfamily)